MQQPKPALLLIAHGSRRAEANADLDALADQFRAMQNYSFVQTSFLELAEPNIATGGQACAQAGAKYVVMVPYFLSPGVHVKDDLTEARDTLTVQFPDVRFVLAEPIGRHPLMLEIVQNRVEEALRVS